MRKVGLFEAKQKLSELVERASRGERIGITKRGKLTAQIIAVEDEVEEKEIAEIFKSIEGIRRRSKPMKGVTTKDLIEEGRR